MAFVPLPDEDVAGLVDLKLVRDLGIVSVLDAVIRPQRLIEAVCDDLIEYENVLPIRHITVI